VRLGHILKIGIFFICILSSTYAQNNSWRRTVLGFWDSNEFDGQDNSASEIHENLEVVLNHYGLKVEYVDVAKGIPEKFKSKDHLKKYRGVISWFVDEEMKDPFEYLKVLKAIRSARIPILVMGDLGFLIVDKKKQIEMSTDIVNQYLNPFDLEFKGDFFDNPLILEPVINGDVKRVEFERKLDKEIRFVRVVKRLGPGDTWLKINILGDKDSSDVIFVNSKITYVQSGYALFTNPINYKRQWRVNPFEIVQKTFFKDGADIVPDVTTLFGRRTFFSHIDGDGYINVSQVDHKTYSGNIVVDEILEKYKLPVMVSVIIAEVSSKYLGNKSIEKDVRKIYALPYVEGGSHTYTHPMSWELEPKYSEKLLYLDEKEIVDHKGPIVGYPIKDYVMNYEREVIESIDYINKHFMPEGKKARTLLWSGSCAPPEKPLELLDKANFLNMNGGDGKFDGVDASYTGLSPLYRQVGKYTQVYSSNANENLYTNLWEGPYSGFSEVIEAFKNTESPIRIRPINIYYHFYSGERISSVKALKDTYDYVLKQEINPIFPSRYIQMVHGWMNIDIKKLDQKQYEISNNGDLRTIRLDNTDLYPDYRKSKNIVGHKYLNESLYIYLGAERKSTLVLSKKSPEQPYIKDSSVIVNSFNNGVIEGESFYPGEINIMNKGKASQIKIPNIGTFKVKVVTQ